MNKPCPFCGDAPEIEIYGVCCHYCDIDLLEDKWNERPIERRMEKALIEIIKLYMYKEEKDYQVIDFRMMKIAKRGLGLSDFELPEELKDEIQRRKT